MKKAIWNKLAGFMLAFAVATVTILASVVPVEAETKTTVTDYYKSENDETATAGVEKKFEFSALMNGTAVFCILTNQASDVQISIYDDSGNLVNGITNPYSISEDQYILLQENVYMVANQWNLSKGNYTCGLTFDKDTTFAAWIYRETPEVSISNTSLELTVGYSKSLSVSGEKVKSWTSKNKSIATVDKKGKVTGKQAGKTTITATLVDGRMLKCTVTIRKNQYTDTKGTIDDVPSGSVYSRIYWASLDEKGNLHIRANILNNTEKRITSLCKMKIVVRDEKGKLVGYCKVDKKSLSVPAHSAKSTTFIIEKSEIRRKADLTKASITCEGSYRATKYR